MPKYSVFMSRVTNEFAAATRAIRDLAVRDAWPMLQVFDQEQPSVQDDLDLSDITVEKLISWIEPCDEVFLYVGSQLGGAAKVPSSERKKIVRYLPPAGHEHFDTLQQVFAERQCSPDEITYTQLEAVIALGLRKKLTVFQLNSHEALTQSAQEAYRAWLKRQHLGGRDRTEDRDLDALIKATHRKLQERDVAVRKQILAEQAGKSPLWESICAMAQPSSNDAERRWRVVRGYQGPSTIDWVKTCERVGDAPLPGLILKGIGEPAATTAAFLIRLPNDSKIVVHDGGYWRTESILLDQSKIRATCFHANQFWVLALAGDRFELRCLGPGSPSGPFEVAGYDSDNFEKIHLYHNGSHFHLEHCGVAWRLDPPTRDVASYTARRIAELPDAGDSIAMLFPTSSAQGLRWGFTGLAYDTSVKTPDWALVNHKQEACCVSLRLGALIDAFCTVDLTLKGNWETRRLQLVGDVQWLGINEPAEERSERIPLFQAASRVAWTLSGAGFIDLLKSGVGDTYGTDCFRVVPEAQTDLEPFCFVQRQSSSAGNETRFRVWLIPVRFDADLIGMLNEFLTALRPLPESPIASLEHAESPLAVDPWWRILWDKCQA